MKKKKKKKKQYQNFLSDNFQFLVVKFPVYLNRHVFVLDVLVKSKGHGRTAYLDLGFLNIA